MDRKEYINELYNQIAEELSISQTMIEKAISSYEAVGKWLGECEPGLDVKIMSQGSFNLGTIIKPLSDKDDYDIDLVCLLANGAELQAKEIKQIVGERLKENKRYKAMLDKEGKRCWTIQYDEFHMDILPSVPKGGTFVEPQMTEIRLTHKKADDFYEDRFSNPYQYREWFQDRMKTVLLEAKSQYAARNRVEISTVPIYRVKTPLQKAIQLLKRHRDIMFENDQSGDAPISIIITTLAAKAYGNESNLYDALYNVVNHMMEYVEIGGDGRYRIENPVMSEENFADKWNEKPHKAECFKRWLAAVKNDILNCPMALVGTEEISKGVKNSFGEGITNRAYNKIAENNKQSRNNGTLYIDGLQGGLTTKASCGNRPVMEHTFYGKD